MGREFSLDDIMEVEEKALQGIMTVYCIISLWKSVVLLVLSKGKSTLTYINVETGNVLFSDSFVSNMFPFETALLYGLT